MSYWERTVAGFAVATCIGAWIVGLQRPDIDFGSYLRRVLPTADAFEPCGMDSYVGSVVRDGEQRRVGYVAIGAATGYGGPLRLAVGVDMTGELVGSAVIEHCETAAYFQRVIDGDVSGKLIGKRCSDSFRVGDDVDAVTGATMTTAAVANSAGQAARRIGLHQLRLPLPPEQPLPVKVGIPEAVLLALYVVTFASYLGRPKSKRVVRWMCLIVGLVVFGFWYNVPITLANVNSLLLGYWPQWQSHLYWYLLIVGVLLLPILTGRNPYCSSMCPFGAAQQCLRVVGGAKTRFSLPWRKRLRWVPRLLAWGAIVLALLYRNPSVATYEVYGALFTLIGSHFQFGLLAVFLIASLFIRRPWCNYACPIHAVTDFLRLARKRPSRPAGR